MRKIVACSTTTYYGGILSRIIVSRHVHELSYSRKVCNGSPHATNEANYYFKEVFQPHTLFLIKVGMVSNKEVVFPLSNSSLLHWLTWFIDFLTSLFTWLQQFCVDLTDVTTAIKHVSSLGCYLFSWILSYVFSLKLFFFTYLMFE